MTVREAHERKTRQLDSVVRSAGIEQEQQLPRLMRLVLVHQNFTEQAPGKWNSSNGDEQIIVDQSDDDEFRVSQGDTVESAERWLARQLVGDPRASAYVQLVLLVLAGNEQPTIVKDIAAKTDASRHKLEQIDKFIQHLNRDGCLSNDGAENDGGLEGPLEEKPETDLKAQDLNLDGAAEKIRGLHLRNFQTFVEIGRTLLTIKGALQHGDFEPWITKARLGFDLRSAQNYMALARFCQLAAETVSSIEELGRHVHLRAAYLIGREQTPPVVRKDAARLLSKLRDKGEVLTLEMAQQLLLKYLERNPRAPSPVRAELKRAKTTAELMAILDGDRVHGVKKLEKIKNELTAFVRAKAIENVEQMDRAAAAMLKQLV